MTTIKLHNTATRTKEVFTPLDPTNVRMYVCGPTVYDRAHLGNARPVVVFDVLFRLLRHVYGENSVTYVRNFTDVDDRINETAQKRHAAGDIRPLTELIRERSDETIQWYHDDMGALGTLPPTHEPRATEYIPQMVAMIEELIGKGVAYEAQGHVLFSVDAYDAYGALSGRSVEDMIAGARVEVAPYKKNPMDFVLWKPSSDDLPGWDSPWGGGVRDGTSSARPWPATCWARHSTSTPAASTCSFPTTRTRSPRANAPAARTALPGCGCTTKCCRWRARRCPRAWAISSPCGTCWTRACRAR